MVDLTKMNLDALKKELKKGDAIRDSGLIEPKTVTAIKNLSYGPYGTENLLEVYYPNNPEALLPTILNVHGGGFFYGDKELYRFYAMSLAERGFCVVNFNYRLAPKNCYPAPLQDINQVLIWMLSQKTNYPFDFNHLFLVGDSAGGQLAEQYATITCNKKYANLFNFDVPPIVIKGLGLNCGAYFLGTELNPIEHFAFYINQNHKESYQAQFPVEDYITKDFPPTSITTASHDFLKDLANPLAKLLIENGIKTEFTIYENSNNDPLQHVFHIGQKQDISKKCNDEQMAFFKSLI